MQVLTTARVMADRCQAVRRTQPAADDQYQSRPVRRSSPRVSPHAPLPPATTTLSLLIATDYHLLPLITTDYH